MICVSIAEHSVDLILEELQHVAMAEIRLDLLTLSDA